MAVASPPPAADAAAVKRQLDELGVSYAEAARRVGYTSLGGVEYVRRVLRGANVSAKLVARLREVAAEIAAERSPIHE